MIAFSASLMIRLLRSGPATTRSSASLNSGVAITFLFRRAARIAASLTRLARSAPEKPGDWRAGSWGGGASSCGLALVWDRAVLRGRPHGGGGRGGQGG